MNYTETINISFCNERSFTSNLSNLNLFQKLFTSSVEKERRIDLRIITMIQLSESDMRILGNSHKFQFLSALTFNRSYINTQAMQTFSLYLKEPKNLEHLAFDCCNLEIQEVKILASALKQLGIQSLKFNEDYIKNEVISILCEVLEGHSTLHEIDFSNSGIQKEGYKILAQALVHNHNLHSLKLTGNTHWHNFYGEEYIITALKVNSSLRFLDLSFISLTSKKAIKLFDQILSEKTSLQGLNLGENYLDEEVIPSIERIVNKGILRLSSTKNLYGLNVEKNLLYKNHLEAQSSSRGEQILQVTKENLSQLLSKPFRAFDSRRRLLRLKVLELQNITSIEANNLFNRFKEDLLRDPLNVEEIFITRVRLDNIGGQKLLRTLPPKIKKLNFFTCGLHF